MNRFPKWLGIIPLIIGLLMSLGSLAAWQTVSQQLSEEKIIVPADAKCEQNKPVNGPVSAYCQAEVIKHHALAGSEGLTYAELGAKIKQATDAKDQAAVDKWTKARTSAMNGSFLRASLFTSVLAYGVSALALGTGLSLMAIGAALLSMGRRRHDHDDHVVTTTPVTTTTTTKPVTTKVETDTVTTKTTGTTHTTGATATDHK